MSEKKKDPWTDPDPQPGDFDEYLDEMEWGRGEIRLHPDLKIRLISDEEAVRNQAWRDAQRAAAAEGRS
jgi:hypothetical protein